MDNASILRWTVDTELSLGISPQTVRKFIGFGGTAIMDASHVVRDAEPCIHASTVVQMAGGKELWRAPIVHDTNASVKACNTVEVR